MRNTLIASLIGLALVGGTAVPASALTFDEVQAQVRELLARVANLTAQLNALKNQGVGIGSETSIGVAPNQGYPHRVCGLLNRNLSQGMSGDDVRGIQEYLRNEGLLNTAPTGYFGPLTGQAIAKWQAKEGLTQAGILGPLSRERIKRWCGGGEEWQGAERFTAAPARGEAPLTVTFDTWLSGFRPITTYYTIDFGDGTSERAADCPAPADACIAPGQNKHTYSQNGTYSAVLYKVTDPCAHSPLTCKAPIQRTEVAKRSIVVGPVACTKEYKPVCGLKQVICITAPCNPIQQTYGNRCTMEADGATFIHEGECRGIWDDPAQNPQCKSWYDGCNTCSRETPNSPAMCTLRACPFDGNSKPYCTSYFDGGSGNKPPTISSFSGPTVLKVDESGTWSIRASDPENSSLSYNIVWGDEVANIYAASADRAFVQSTSFTHSYSRAGTYTVTIVVRDEVGKTATATATVRVSTGSVGCTEEYAPVCGRPSGCVNTCPAGVYCSMICQMPEPKTYSNRCNLNVAGADFLYEGACTTSGVICTADAYQCPNGTWVGRTGPNCQFVCN